MKKIFFVGFILFSLFSCSQHQKEQAAAKSSDGQSGAPEINFEKTEHNFNTIIMGERVEYSFHFTNTGDAPLIITGIRSGCGCTVGDYPKDPLKPGEEGKIKVVFNSSGKKGFQSQSVRILNNSPESTKTLRITAEVIEQ